MGAYMPAIKLTDGEPTVSRELLLPAAGLEYQERLNRANAVNLAENARFEFLPAGYVRVLPVDPSRRHGD